MGLLGLHWSALRQRHPSKSTTQISAHRETPRAEAFPTGGLDMIPPCGSYRRGHRRTTPVYKGFPFLHLVLLIGPRSSPVTPRYRFFTKLPQCSPKSSWPFLRQRLRR